MDDDLIRKAKEALMARVSSPAPNIYNIVIPVSEQGAEKLIEIFGSLIKREDYGTDKQNLKRND